MNGPKVHNHQSTITDLACEEEGHDDRVHKAREYLETCTCRGDDGATIAFAVWHLGMKSWNWNGFLFLFFAL